MNKFISIFFSMLLFATQSWADESTGPISWGSLNSELQRVLKAHQENWDQFPVQRQ